MAKKKQAPEPVRHLVSENRKARRQYEVLATYEAGVVLTGTEVKTLRGGLVSIAEVYARFDGDSLMLVGAHIDEYTHGNRANHLPNRKRKLLLHKRELTKLKAKIEQRGLTLVPLMLYFNDRGWAKVSLGLCRGRKVADKREKDKEREDRREMRRVL